MDFRIRYHDRDTGPDRLVKLASHLGITPERLTRRFISEGPRAEGLVGPSEPGKT